MAMVPLTTGAGIKTTVDLYYRRYSAVVDFGSESSSLWHNAPWLHRSDGPDYPVPWIIIPSETRGVVMAREAHRIAWDTYLVELAGGLIVRAEVRIDGVGLPIITPISPLELLAMESE